MWGKKPKGWESLSEEDRAWAKDLGKRNAFEMLLRAIDQKRLSCANFILESYEFKRRSHRLTALRHAIDARQASLVSAILAAPISGSTGFDFCNSADDQNGAREILQKATAMRDAPVWQALYKVQKETVSGHLDEKEIVRILLENPIPDALLCRHIDVMSQNDHSAFDILYKTVREKCPEQKKLVLGYVAIFFLPYLATYLSEYASQGDIDMTRALLDIDANPPENNADIFFKALLGKHDAIIEMLLPYVNFQPFGENIRQALESNIQDADLRVRALKAFHEAHPRVGDEVYGRVDDQTLSEVKIISAELRLTTLFNFHFGKETTIAEKMGDSPAVATVVRDFADFSRAEALEEMREKLIELDGHPDELNISPVRKGALQQKQFNPMTS